jgi:hypothetical protein
MAIGLGKGNGVGEASWEPGIRIWIQWSVWVRMREELAGLGAFA